MGDTEITPKHKESSATGETKKGFSSQASKIGASERNPVCSEFRGSSGLGDYDKDSLSEPPQMGAAARSPVEQESSVRRNSS